MIELELCNSLLDEIHNFTFENNFSLSNADEAILFYTARPITRGLLKRLKCVGCQERVSAGRETITIEDKG